MMNNLSFILVPWNVFAGECRDDIIGSDWSIAEVLSSFFVILRLYRNDREYISPVDRAPMLFCSL